MGIFETKGGSRFVKNVLILRNHPKKKNKTLKLVQFTVNMSFKMHVRGCLPPPISSQFLKDQNMVQGISTF